ncbi:hypothetical protein BDV40DRAFT_252992 [Aspergillus tamarii]|uniref:Uncharacterized protein n=1 Tax=Aspergillus tamarii TaxID=41984 RepID=A0A5N6V9C2_ASPTM|nr:hypothetical protein BDV40DRAFT_252992 [Aspergillus tamarii]
MTAFKNQKFSALGDIPITLPPPGSGYKADDKPSDADMGKDDPNTRSYINVNANKIPSRFHDRVLKLEEAMNLMQSWLDTHAGIQVKHRKADGSLPTDSSQESGLKRSDYRNKVVDTILSENCAWVMHNNEVYSENNIHTSKSEFHLSMISDMLVGLLDGITGISKTIEDVFTGLANLIFENKNQVQSRTVWSLFHVFLYDETTDDVRTYFRIINYSITAEMVEYVSNKTTHQEVSMGFNFHLTDLSLNENEWDRIKDTVQKFIDDTAANQVEHPIDGEISV